MKPFFFYIGLSKDYIPGIHAFLNSFELYDHQRECDVIISSNEDCKDYIKWIMKEYNFVKWIKNDSTDHICNSRFYPLVENDIFNSYFNGCLMDADMFFTSNLLNIFKSISPDIPIAICRDCTNRTYTKESYPNNFKSDFNEKNAFHFFNCTVPFFFNWRNLKVKNMFFDVVDRMKNHRDNDIGDMENLNIAIQISGLLKQPFIELNCEQYTQLRFSFMNPLSRAVLKPFEDDEISLNSNVGSLPFIITSPHSHHYRTVHGKFWVKGWVNFFKDEFHKHLRNSFGFSDCDFKDIDKVPDCAVNNLTSRAFESLKILQDLFFEFFMWKKIPTEFILKSDRQYFEEMIKGKTYSFIKKPS